MLRENNIWLVLDSRTNGGIETHVLELAKGMDARGLEVTVIFLENYGLHPLREALCEAGIATFSLDGRFRSLLKNIRKYRPALIHSHGYKAGIFCCAAAHLTGSAHVSTFHAGDPGKGKLALYDWLHRQAARFIDVNFTVSAEISSRVPATTQVINNFVLLPELGPKTGQQLAFVGRLSEEKGPDRLLQTAGQLPQVRFEFYGDGPLMDSLKCGASANCSFHGNQADMADHWSNIDLLLMPSRYEGLPMAALEAMARGIPVVAFDVGALDQVIESGENGWLVQPNNLNAFQDVIEHWLSLNRLQKQVIGVAARQRIASQFSARKNIPLILEQYHRATGSRFPTCDAFCE